MSWLARFFGVFGQIAGELAAGDAQQVEVFPIEFALVRRAGQHDHPYETFEMEQRNQRPGARLVDQPGRDDCVLAMSRQAPPQRIAIDDKAVALEKLARLVGHRLSRYIERAPLPTGGQRQLATVAGDKQ